MEQIQEYKAFSEGEIRLLKTNKIVPEDTSPEQVAFFAEVCKRKRLDPFLRQIHLVQRNEKLPNGEWKKSYTIQAGIDGMRAIAQRNGKIAGIERGVKYVDNKLYGWCRIKTKEGGEYYDELAYDEYVQKTKDGKPNRFWERMPETMIKKCAEESVLRMCAPEDLSGVYGDDEMQQADNEVALVPITGNTSLTSYAAPTSLDDAPSAEEIKTNLKQPFEPKPSRGERATETSEIPVVDKDLFLDGKTIREWVMDYGERTVFDDYVVPFKTSLGNVPLKDCDPVKLVGVWKKLNRDSTYPEVAIRIQAFLTSDGLPF